MTKRDPKARLLELLCRRTALALEADLGAGDDADVRAELREVEAEILRLEAELAHPW